jgi:hypothetical protein
MKILLGTPVHGGTVCLGYHEAVVRLLAFFHQNFPKIHFEQRSPVCSMVTFARNLLASIVLNDKSYSHLLFIDSDMVFSPALIARMIAFNKPVVGCICPMKSFDYQWFHASGVVHQDPMIARLLATAYVSGEALMMTTGPNGERWPEVVDGFVRAHFGGTGIMLIRRDVFEQIKQRHPDLWVEKPNTYYAGFGLSGGVLQCFETIRGDDGIHNGEDVSFCHRWVKGCGGEIWCCIDEVVGHIGQESFFGQYIVKMQKGESLFSLPAENVRPSLPASVPAHLAPSHPGAL